MSSTHHIVNLIALTFNIYGGRAKTVILKLMVRT